MSESIEIVGQDGEVAFSLVKGDRYAVRSAPDSEIWNTRYVLDVLDRDRLLVYQARSDIYAATRETIQELFDIGDARKEELPNGGY